MILDSVNQFHNYIHLHPLFPEVSKYINSIDANNIRLGTHEISGKDIFVIISNSILKTDRESKLEIHDNYIDIQIPLSKTERFGWDNRRDLVEPIDAYDQAKDILFYNDIPSTYIDVKPLNFIIFYPEDAHAPCIGEGYIVKIVIKVKFKYTV